jgi:predicted ferric reductase
MKKAACLLFLGCQILVILGFWGWNHVYHPMGNQLTGDRIGQLLAYGRLAGLLAAFAILLQLILIGRGRWIGRTFGLDRLTHLHHGVGFALVSLLLAHPILLTFGHALQADVSPWAQFIDFCRSWEDVLAAVIGLGLLLGAVAFSVAVVVKRIRYEVWYATHLTLYLALALAFGHQLSVGSDFTDNRWFRIYWIALYAGAFGSLILNRGIRPLLDFVRHRFVVARVVEETTDVTSVYIEGRNLPVFPVEAGQFMTVRFLAPGFRWEAHPFSMSCRPDGKHLRLTIKQLGDFTRRIPKLRPGTRVFIDGPHGIFTARHNASNKLLLIAGGIGITPIRALAEEFVVEGREVILLYGNRNKSAVVFEQELETLVGSSAGRLRVVHVMSDDPAWIGERGRIDAERLARLVPDVLLREVYLCGPPLMMKSVRSALARLGVSRRRLHDERFAL